MALIPNDRLQQLLLRTRDAAAKRDAALRKVDELTQADDAADRAVEYIEETLPPHMHTCTEQAAAMAAQVQSAGRGAEASHKRVREMDARLSRVRAALETVEAVVKQRSSVKNVKAAIDAGSLDKAVDCIVQYNSVAAILKNFPAAHRDGANSDTGTATPDQDTASDPGTNESLTSPQLTGSDVSGADADDTIRHARDDLRASLTDHLDSAAREGKHDDVAKYAEMLARMGFVDEACAAFTRYVVDDEEKALAGDVEKALGDVNAGKMTHVRACADVLDRIVVAIEKHKPYMEKTFKRMDALILALHSKATQHCVNVLRDFIATRKGVVGASKKPKHGRTGSSSAMSPRGAAPSVDPRSLDQALEDMSHLLTCCHIYIQFIDSQVSQNAEVKAKLSDSVLVKEVSSLMSIYVPMQAEYLAGAFHVAAQDTDEVIASVMARVPGAARDAAADKAAGGLMSTFGLFGASGGDAEDGTGHSGREDGMLTSICDVVSEMRIHLVDDIFYVLLVAIRRAMGTRDVSIASSTMIQVNELISDRLAAELRTRVHNAFTHRDVPALVRWLEAAYKTIEYTSKIATDSEQAAATNFTGTDLFRFTEQKHDFTATAKQLREQLEQWCAQLGKQLALTLHDGIAAFEKFNYVLRNEATYVQCGVVDPWVKATMERCTEELAPYRMTLQEPVLDDVVLKLLGAVGEAIEASVMKKHFDAFGALQFDRELRTLRAGFSALTDRPVRDKFARLQAVAQVLMADSPKDAADLGEVPGLSRAEVRSIVLLRADFSADDVRAKFPNSASPAPAR